MKKFDYSEQIPVDEIRKQITGMDTSFFNDKIMMNLALCKNEVIVKILLTTKKNSRYGVQIISLLVYYSTKFRHKMCDKAVTNLVTNP